MATVHDVRVHRRRVPLLRPFVTAVRTAHAVEAVLVEVRDSEGRSGWGEAAVSWRVTGESPASVEAAVLGPLRAVLVGLPVDDPHDAGAAAADAVVGNSSARAAVESALFDLAAQVDDAPLWRYLGATSPHVLTDMTLSAVTARSSAEEVASLAAEHAAAGFGTLKVKAGGGGDDVAGLAAIRRSVGDAVTLRVDANQGWTPEQAIATIRAWEDAGLGIELVEQPVHRDDLDGLALVGRHVATPIMADESVWSRRDLTEVLARGGVSLVNVKLAKTGGLREARALADMATQSGIGIVVGCMSESHVGIAAAAALAAALAAGEGARPYHGAHDLDAGLWTSAGPVTGGPVYEGQVIDLTDAPGCGFRGLAAPDDEQDDEQDDEPDDEPDAGATAQRPDQCT